MKICIHSFVNLNSYEYFSYMVRNYKATSSNDKNIIFRAYALESGVCEKLNSIESVAEVIEVYRYPRYFVKQTFRDYMNVALALIGVYRRMRGSNGHAAGLNAAFTRVGKNMIDVIADTDTVILKKDWDRLLIYLLNHYGAIGCSYEEIGGFSSGNGRTQTYKRIPNLTWLALSPSYDFRRFDPTPSKSSTLVINSRELSDLYNLPVTYELARDVGWKLPSFLKQQQIPYAVFSQTKPTSSLSIAVKSGNDYHEEFQWCGEPVIGHQRGSHQHAFRETEISKSFYDACEAFLARQGIRID